MYKIRLTTRPALRLSLCDQIRLFLKDIGNKFSYKNCLNVLSLFGLFLKQYFFT